ncbi:hypothetical protein LJR034_009172 [Caballeronia sp. LjRoot34]
MRDSSPRRVADFARHAVSVRRWSSRAWTKLAAGRGSRHDVDLLSDIDKLMHGTTHCGLGGSACNALHDTIVKFRPAYERRLKSLRFEPAFDLDAELEPARRLTGRDDPASHLESTA